MRKYHVCHVCGEKMHPTLETRTYCFKGINITVEDVCVFRCENCGEGILESQEVERVEEIVLARVNVEKD